MIILTKLDNTPVLINLEAIKYIEGIPDTIIFFLNGDSIIVKEKIEEIQNIVIKYKRDILQNIKTDNN